MTNTEEKTKQPVSKASSQTINPAKAVSNQKLPVKLEYSWDKESNKKNEK